MISTQEFHQQIESLAVSFTLDGQHVFANLFRESVISVHQKIDFFFRFGK